MKYKLPHFEEMDLTQLEEYYDVEIEDKANKISIDLNIEGKAVAAPLFDAVKRMLENIAAEDQKNRAYIAANFEDEEEDMVKEYLEFHLEELEEELAGMINFEDKSKTPEKQLLEKLKLVRIGFYPDGKYESESFAVFDYLLDEELSDEIIVVNLDQAGKLINLAWES